MRNQLKCGLLLISLSLILITGCDKKNSVEDQSKKAVQDRTTTYSRAQAVVPFDGSVLQNFPMRDALVQYTERQDLNNHPWYIYILGDNGNYIGYFVGKTYPQSTCNFLSSTESIAYDQNGNVLQTAPSYDGIYYGGGGSSGGGCDYFFFDASTNAMQVISNQLKWFVSDAPLKLEVQPIQVR